VLLSLLYRLVRGLLGVLIVVCRGDRSKDAELLVLRHENALLRRQVACVRYDAADRVWLACLARLVPRRRWAEIFSVTRRPCWPGTADWWRANGNTTIGADRAAPTAAATKTLIMRLAREKSGVGTPPHPG
jgi:hypothetical protein